jgi:hypothetical protein
MTYGEKRLSGMDHRMTALERAFDLARSGQVSGLSEIVAALRREGYSRDQIEGPVLRRQLTSLIKTARQYPYELAFAIRSMTSL